MILGLDISTAITGISIIDREGEIIICEAWRFQNKKKFPDLYAKAAEVKENLLKVKMRYPIEAIYIEQSLWAFRSGQSSAKTILTLSKFNGIVAWLVYEIFDIKPEFLGATQARKLCGVPIKEKGGDLKKVVLNFILDTEPYFCYDKTKFGNPVPGTYDRADSLIIAKAGAKCLQAKN